MKEFKVIISIIKSKTKEEIVVKSIEVKDFYAKFQAKTITSLYINNNFYLHQTDKVNFSCDKCNKISVENFSFKNNFLQEKHLCRSCRVKKLKLEKYGNETYNNTNKMKKTKLERYGDENYVNSKKAKKTTLERYGVEHNMQLKECRDKVRKTWKEKYGIEEVLSLKKKKEEGMVKKYGVKNPFESEEIKEKIKQTNLKKYGVEHLMKDPERAKEIQNKLQKTMMKKYGVRNSVESEEIKEKISNTKTKNNSWGRGGKSKWYLVEGQKVQGTFELSLANWLIDNNIKFISHNMKGIKYKDKDNKMRYYYPDFYLPDFDIYLEPHAKYFWDEKFEWKMKEIEKQVDIIYFNEDFHFQELLEKLK